MSFFGSNFPLKERLQVLEQFKQIQNLQLRKGLIELFIREEHELLIRHQEVRSYSLERAQQALHETNNLLNPPPPPMAARVLFI